MTIKTNPTIAELNVYLDLGLIAPDFARAIVTARRERKIAKGKSTARCDRFLESLPESGTVHNHAPTLAQPVSDDAPTAAPIEDVETFDALLATADPRFGKWEVYARLTDKDGEYGWTAKRVIAVTGGKSVGTVYSGARNYHSGWCVEDNRNEMAARKVAKTAGVKFDRQDWISGYTPVIKRALPAITLGS